MEKGSRLVPGVCSLLYESPHMAFITLTSCF